MTYNLNYNTSTSEVTYSLTQSAKGDTGSQGVKGDQGIQGIQGVAGADTISTTLREKVNSAVAVGTTAATYNQGQQSVAVGLYAATNNQGQRAVAIGANAAVNNQGIFAVAIGSNAGLSTQGDYAIGIGLEAGNTTQHNYAIAIGNSAGYTNQGINSIAIGTNIGYQNQPANSIVISAYNNTAVGTTDAGAVANAFYVTPIRTDPTNLTNNLNYNTSTNEITYSQSVPASNVYFYYDTATSTLLVKALDGTVLRTI